MGVGLQADEKDRWLHLVGAKNPLQLAVVGDGLADRLGPFVDDVERVVDRDVFPEPGLGEQAAVLEDGAQVVAHPHLAHELLGSRGDADLEVVHAGLDHQLGELGVEVVGSDVGRPANIAPALGLHRPQQLLGVVDVATGRNELGIGEPETANPAPIELMHLSDHLIDGINPDRLALNDRVDAVAAVVGAAPLSLNTDVEIAAVEVPIELRPDRGDVVVVAGRLLHAGGLLVNQTRPWRVSRQETSLVREGLPAQELLQQRLTLTDGDDGAAGETFAELFVEDTDGAAAKNRLGLGVMAPRPPQAAAHKAQVAP